MNNHSCLNGCRYVPLTLRKIDGISGKGIPGAIFELTVRNGLPRRGTTDDNGLLTFCTLICNNYVLREVSPPAGYAPVDHDYNIRVNACGCIFVDGRPTSRLIIRNTPALASFTAIKVDIQNGMPLAGAVYTLYMDSSVVAGALSNAAGQVTFTGLSPGTYELVETTPPPGFQTNTERLAVVVAQDGSATIDGRPANGFMLNNAPLSGFVFLKLDALTGFPLAEATFTLTQGGAVIGTAVSGIDGLVNFGLLAAGTYQLTETIAPPGYQPNSAVYQVVVGIDGSVTVDNAPLDGFVVEDIPIAVSAPPTIDTIAEGAVVITGTGIPGAQITVTLPDGSTVFPTVSAGGTWTANVPVGSTLAAGEIVTANQTEPGKLISGAVHEIVIGNNNFLPGIDVYIENLTTGLNYARAGDVLLYDVILSNNGAASSVWQSAYATFFLSSYVALQENSLRINNRTVTPSQYSYDSTANTLTVYLGDIVAGASVSVSYRVLLNNDIPNIYEIILDAVLGSLA